LLSAVAVLLSLLSAGVVLSLRGETINAMVLAGLTLAVVVLVDDAIVDTDNLKRRLRQRRDAGHSSSTTALVEGSLAGRRVLAYVTIAILLSLLPLFILRGEMGAFLPPLALSYAAAVLASMVVALTITPVLSMLFLSNKTLEGAESPLLRRLRHGYDRLLSRFVRSTRAAGGAIAVLALVGLGVVPFVGRNRSLVPSFRDTNVLVRLTGPPGTSLTEMDRISARAIRELRTLPGVRHLGAHVGRAVLGDQAVGTNSAELWVTVDPTAGYDKTVSSVQAVIDGYPGLERAVLTYPNQRIAEVLDTKNRALTVRVYGEDLAVLRSKANEVQRALSHIHGVANPTVQVPVEEPAIQIEVNLAAAQQAGIKPGDVRRAEATVLSGLEVGALFQDQKVFEVVVRGVPSTRNSLTDVRNLLIDTPSGGTVHLGQVATVSAVPTESEIRHEDVSRFVDVGADLHGRNAGSVARDVNNRLKGISFPLEYHPQVVGDYVQGHAAHLRFIEVLVGAAAGIILLLQAAFGSWRLAFLVFMTLPLALTGGLLATWADGGTITLGSVVGFFAVFAIAARSCVILIDRYRLLAAEQGVTSLSENGSCRSSWLPSARLSSSFRSSSSAAPPATRSLTLWWSWCWVASSARRSSVSA
jgi:Cu/Ag efflux pump CusA